MSGQPTSRFVDAPARFPTDPTGGSAGRRRLAGVLGGDELLPLIVLALGAAMAFGSGLALVRPPPDRREGDLERAPVVRSLVFLGVGLVAAVWAVGSIATR